VDEARQGFLRMVSHELRTPLNSIIGFSEILSCELYGPLGSPQYKEYAGIIRESGHRLLRLVNQVMEMARLESGAEPFDLRLEPLDQAIEDAMRAVAEEASQRRISVVAEIAGPAPLAFADARALRTILVNLLQNAIAHAPEGSEVKVSAAAHGPLATLEVRDAGPGVDPAEVSRLMRPFEQGENALVRQHQGAGLGWPIVQLLTQALGGRFSVRTELGEGLTATVVLRRAA
jgi:signal transduction histidine kinase